MINSNWSGSWHLILANYKPLCFWGKKKKEKLRPFTRPLTEECGSSSRNTEEGSFYLDERNRVINTSTLTGVLLCCCLARLSRGPGGWGAHQRSRIRDSDIPSRNQLSHVQVGPRRVLGTSHLEAQGLSFPICKEKSLDRNSGSQTQPHISIPRDDSVT